MTYKYKKSLEEIQGFFYLVMLRSRRTLSFHEELLGCRACLLRLYSLGQDRTCSIQYLQVLRGFLNMFHKLRCEQIQVCILRQQHRLQDLDGRVLNGTRN